MIDVGLSPTRIHAGEVVDLEITLTNAGIGTCTNVIFVIKLPVGIVRLRGRERIETSSLPAGQSITSHLRIRADKADRYRLTSTNFSYQDHRGRPYREHAFATEITVAGKRDPLPAPQIMVEVQPATLPYGKWTILRGRITNTGAVSVSDLEITLSGQVATDRRSAHGTLEQLPPGRSADVPFFVRAQAAGTDVPVHLDLAYRWQSRRHVIETTHSIRVLREHEPKPWPIPESCPPPVRVLVLAANPPDTGQLRIDEEVREIQKTIQSGSERDTIDVIIRLAVRPEDISEALLREKPRLVHFAGHGGGPDESFAAEGEYGLAHIIPVDGLVQLFRVAGQSVECVIVNACRTELLARALSSVIPYAIGMRQPVTDKSAIKFSIGFYQAMAAGLPIDDAFDLGVAQLKMLPPGADPSAPILFRRGASIPPRVRDGR